MRRNTFKQSNCMKRGTDARNLREDIPQQCLREPTPPSEFAYANKPQDNLHIIIPFMYKKAQLNWRDTKPSLWSSHLASLDSYTTVSSYIGSFVQQLQFLLFLRQTWSRHPGVCREQKSRFKVRTTNKLQKLLQSSPHRRAHTESHHVYSVHLCSLHMEKSGINSAEVCGSGHTWKHVQERNDVFG